MTIKQRAVVGTYRGDYSQGALYDPVTTRVKGQKDKAGGKPQYNPDGSKGAGYRDSSRAYADWRDKHPIAPLNERDTEPHSSPSPSEPNMRMKTYKDPYVRVAKSLTPRRDNERK